MTEDARCSPDAKRQRLEALSPLISLPSDLRIRILDGYLDVNELDEYACVSRQCRADSRHTALPQDRWGTLTIPSTAPEVRVVKTLKNANRRGVFKRINCLKVRYERVQGQEGYYSSTRKANPRERKLLNVERLELVYPSKHPRGFVPTKLFKLLCRLMPNLRHVKFAGLMTRDVAATFAELCPTMESFVWQGGVYGPLHLEVDGRRFNECRSLTALTLDGHTLLVSRTTPDMERDDLIDLLPKLKGSLEVVSVRDVRMSRIHFGYTDPPKVLPPTVLVRFVREAPHLRWFRSDLDADTVAMLKAERPEVTFVSE